jgi:hypothetical protein
VNDHRLRAFVEDTRQAHGGLRTDWRLVFAKPLTPDDWVDAAMLGGIELSEIIKGHVTDADLAPRVIEAFHAQFPQVEGSFVEFVRGNHGQAELQGIVSGIKGKLFELEYVDYLNHGHLPAGHVAELAHSATQPGWDIAIHDASGHTVELLQAKATQSIAYVKHALDVYPNIDVVTTHEVFTALHDPDVRQHLIDSGMSEHALELKAQAATDAAGHALDYHLPGLALAIIVTQGAMAFAHGRVSARDAVHRVAGRAGRTLLASSVAWVLVAATHEPFIGLPASVLARLGIGRIDVARADTQACEASVGRVREIARLLEGGAATRRALRANTTPLALGPVES